MNEPTVTSKTHVSQKIIHRLRDTTEYQSWRGMRNRCNNPKQSRYADYGGRGIKVCRGWDEFESFLGDMGPKPTPEHTIDRINVNGHYSCGHCDECLGNGWTANCKWATRQEQVTNARSNHVIEFSGKSMTLSQWDHYFGVSPGTVGMRIYRGWSVERALTQPFRKAPINKKVSPA